MSSVAFKWQEIPTVRERGPFRPYEIRSLWDMLDFSGIWLFQTSGTLIKLRDIRKIENPNEFLSKLREANFDSNNPFRSYLTYLGLDVSAAILGQFTDAMKEGPRHSVDEIARLLDVLIETIPNELASKKILMLPPVKAGYLDGSIDLFSSRVRESFPSADLDMTEAQKCFAFDRNTACVIHAMRALEPALNSLACSLGVPAKENWNVLLDQIEKEIRSRSAKTHGESWKIKDESFYAGAAAHFRMVKNAWRNHAMHGKEHYDEERARDIMNSVSALMRHLATRLSEDRPEEDSA